MEKVTINYCRDSGSMYDKSGANIGNWQHLESFTEESKAETSAPSTESLLQLKAAGFEMEEILQLKAHGLIR